MSNNELKNDVYEDLKKKYNTSIEEFAKELAIEIEAAYENVISAFYDSYNPIYYDRTWSTYEASSGAGDHLFPNNLQHWGDSWFAGIGVSPMNIPGKPYRADTSWVFDRTYNKGIHGLTYISVVGRNATIFARHPNMVRRYFKLRKKIKVTMPNGLHLIEMHKKKGFIDTFNLPKVMRVPPKKMMDRQFKKLTTKRRLDKMFTEIFDSKF